MNLPPVHSTPPPLAAQNPREGRRRWVWVLGVICGLFLLGLFLFAWAIFGYIRLHGETRALRNAVLAATDDAFEKKIEVNLGALTLGAARAGLGFVEMPSEARAVLQSVRSAQAGIYERRSRSALDLNQLLESTGQTMADRGWEPLVTVKNRSELVAVFVPANLKTKDVIKVCALVLDGERLVMASARADLEPIFEWIAQHLDRDQKFERVLAGLR
ncbi:MAG: hypothetical protein AB1813_24915 [Verrucomicrobiota bacterium]